MPWCSAGPRQERSVSTPCSICSLQQIPPAVQYSEWLALLLTHSFSLVYATDNSFAVYSDLFPASFPSFNFTFSMPKISLYVTVHSKLSNHTKSCQLVSLPWSNPPRFQSQIETKAWKRCISSSSSSCDLSSCFFTHCV